MKSYKLVLYIFILSFLITNISCEHKSSKGKSIKSGKIIENTNINKSKKELEIKNIEISNTSSIITNAKGKVIDLSHLRKNTSAFNNCLKMAGGYLTSASEAEKQLRKISASHNHPGEWSSNDWQKAYDIMKYADEDTIRFFLNGVVNTVFEDNFSSHSNQCDVIITNLVKIAGNMNNKASANRIIVNASEIESWLNNYDKAIEILQIAIDGMESGDPNEINDYMLANINKATFIAQSGEYKKAENEITKLFNKMPEIDERQKIEAQFQLYNQFVLIKNPKDIIYYGIRKLEEIEKNKNAPKYIKKSIQLELSDIKNYMQNNKQKQ